MLWPFQWLAMILTSVFVLILWQPSMADDLPTCGPKDLHFEFTECDLAGGRWRVSVPTPGTCIGGAPNAATRVEGCSTACDYGEFYDPQALNCTKCPAGTYSLGGGVIFDSWESLPTGFHVTQEPFFTTNFRELSSRSRNQSSNDCSKYGWQPRGDFIASHGGSCSSSLFYAIKLVKPGSLIYTYQYQDETIFFQFQVQNDQCQSIEEAEQNRLPPMTNDRGWKQMTVALKTGLNVLHWKTIEVGADRNRRSKPVMIKRIEIYGVAYTSSCTPCPNGTFSNGQGFKFCEDCPANHYSEKGAVNCTKCKNTEFSANGSTKCRPRPPCTTNDFYEVYTPCDKEKQMQLINKWIEPKICREDLPGAVSLPKPNEKKHCPSCNPGMQYTNSSQCAFCPNNHISDGRGSCKPCPAKMVPKYGYHYHQWYNMPPNMIATCMNVEDISCSSAEGWQLAGKYVYSGQSHTDGVYLLSMTINGFRTSEGIVNGRPVEVGRVTFSFDLQCTGDCELSFMQISRATGLSVVQSWNGSLPQQSFTFVVTQNDTYTFTWAFQKATWDDQFQTSPTSSRPPVEDMAKIYFIDVTNTMEGGAQTCMPCRQAASQDGCTPCPPGHYIDQNITECSKCPPNTYVALTHGEESCQPCGPGLQTQDGVKCFSSCNVTVNGNHYDLISLSGNRIVKGSRLFTASGTQYYHIFNISLCGQHISGNTICANNVSSHSPELERREVSSILCRSTIVPPSQNYDVALSTQSVSLGDHLLGITTATSLGSIRIPKELLGLQEESEIGTTQDLHFYYTSPVSTRACRQGRSSTISLRCDTSQKGTGAIILPKSCPDGTCDGCNFHFLWLTRHACPTCTEKDFEAVKGECLDGKQTLHYIPPKHCLLPSWVNFPNNKIHKCSMIPKELKMIIVATGVTGVILILLVIYFWKKNRKLEYKYMKLVHSSNSKEGELPPAESCAIDDEEEDHFDSIQFKESKSKMLLNKIRAMAGNKFVEDDVMTPISGNYGKGRRIFPQTWL